jgi:guanine deaminase
MRRVGSRILDGDEIVPGSVLVDGDDRVKRVEDAQPEVDVSGVVAPAPTNAHTHLGDRLARKEIEAEDVSLVEAVAPPDSLKHRFLRSLPTKRLVESIRTALEEAEQAGVARTIEFREGGPQGTRALREAAETVDVEVTCLGRPSRAEHWDEEKQLLTDLVDGINISGLDDQPYELSERQAAWARDHDLRLGLHLSEIRREDREAALALAPDLLVHCTMCPEEDLEAIAAADVPVAACPRCNGLFGNRPPLPAMVEAGIDVGLGTDNAMFHDPDPFAEAAYVAREWPALDASTILAMTTTFAFADEPTPTVEEGRRVVVLDDRDGLRTGIEDRRITLPGRIDDD